MQKTGCSLISIQCTHRLITITVICTGWCKTAPSQLCWDATESPHKTQHFSTCTFWRNFGQTSSSAMAERPRELGDFKKARVNSGTITITVLRICTSVSDAADRPASYGNQIVSSTRSIAATYICRQSRGGCDQYCRRPSDVYDTRRRTKLTAPETITRWLILKKRKNRSLSHPLGHLGVTYALHLWLVGKPMVDFIFVVIELFSLSPTVETLWAEIGRSWRFSKGVGHFERRFQRERSVAHQPLLVSE